MPEIEYVEELMPTEELLDTLCPPVRNWFKDTFPDTVPGTFLQDVSKNKDTPGHAG